MLTEDSYQSAKIFDIKANPFKIVLYMSDHSDQWKYELWVCQTNDQ